MFHRAVYGMRKGPLFIFCTDRPCYSAISSVNGSRSGSSQSNHSTLAVTQESDVLSGEILLFNKVFSRA